ncbi:MAG: hypothetical protein L3J42_01035 [Hydrogenimonas sp.]|nr:hypothetical protein [Hydrogenimonas sp.]
MKAWMTLFLALIFLTGCGEKPTKSEKLHFSVLIPQAEPAQSLHYIDGKQVFTSPLEHSIVSAMVVNNPILAGKDAILAIAIENLSDETIELKWDDITFFNPKNYMKLLPISEIEEYFKKPNRCKPLLNSTIFRDQLLKYGVIQDPSADTPASELTATESALHEIFKEIREDLCYTRLPNNTTLEPHKVTVGYMVVQLPEENFSKRMLFMLKIPVAGDTHKLRYALQPLE